MKKFVILALTIALATAKNGHNPGSNYQGPPAPLSSEGDVIDTPEVAHARAVHLAAYAAAAARNADSPKEKLDDVYSNENTEENNGDENTTLINKLTDKNESKHIYQGPLAPLDEYGRVIDTPDVASAKAAHLAAHAAQIHNYHPITWDYGFRNYLYAVPAHIAYTSYHLPTIFHGPPAPLAPDGTVIETPEIKKARADHLRAHARAVAAVASSTIPDNYEKCYH